MSVRNRAVLPETYRDAKVPERARAVIKLATSLGWLVDQGWGAEANGEPFYRLSIQAPSGQPYLWAYLVWYSVPDSDGVQLEKKLFKSNPAGSWAEFRFITDLEKAMAGERPLVAYMRT